MLVLIGVTRGAAAAGTAVAGIAVAGIAVAGTAIAGRAVTRAEATRAALKARGGIKGEPRRREPNGETKKLTNF
jgi:hypothetical protein